MQTLRLLKNSTGVAAMRNVGKYWTLQISLGKSVDFFGSSSMYVLPDLYDKLILFWIVAEYSLTDVCKWKSLET